MNILGAIDPSPSSNKQMLYGIGVPRRDTHYLSICLSIYLSILFFFVLFFWLLPWHAEVPGPGMEPAP